MTLAEYRDTYSWQAALALGPKLMKLAEELPGSEENGLSLQLRTLMVELPATVAADLIGNHTATLAPALKLLTAIELIDNVYPALDTQSTRTAAEELTTRLASANFAERTGDPELAASSIGPSDHPAAPAVESAPAETPVLVSEEAAVSEPAPAAAADPASVAATPAPAAPTVVAVAAEPTTVPVAAAPAPEDTDVHPDSVQ